MQAGQMDKRIQIQESTAARDASGAKAPPIWATITGGTVWSKFISLDAARRGEVFTGGERIAQAEAAFEIRFLAGVSAKHTILDPDAKRWDILGISPLGRKDGLRLLAKVRVD